MLALSPASFNGYRTADETGLPAGNTFLVDSPLNRALGASGGARRRRRSARKALKGGFTGNNPSPPSAGGSRHRRRSARKAMKEGGKSRRHRKTHRRHRRTARQ